MGVPASLQMDWVEALFASLLACSLPQIFWWDRVHFHLILQPPCCKILTSFRQRFTCFLPAVGLRK